jgi:hypothetical protein
VLAAYSSRTGAKGNGGNKALEALAATGPYVFIAGLLILVSAALQFMLAVLAGTDACWANPGLIPPWLVGVALAVGLGLAALLSWRVDPNEFSLNQFYRSRLVRCFLGATRNERHEHPFTGFDFNDDVKFTDLHVASYKGPMPIINTNLNLGASSDLTLHSRHSANFVFTPCYAGCGQAGHDGFHGSASFYQPERGLTLGTAVAISGAAASPNMGSHSSSSVSFLLTLFNVRLGWWVPNTRLKPSTNRRLFGAYALLRELLGQPGDTGWFVNLSDGGHFENLALYELVRRKCRMIIVGDGEQDGELTFGSLGNVIRMCENDFGARISLDVSAIRKKDKNGFSGAHCAVGYVKYEDRSYGTIIYLKSSMTGDEPTDLHQYKADNAAFPHESTGDQFFSEAQFESYRRLGVHIAETALANAADLGTGDGGNLEEFCVQLRKRWFPAMTDRAAFRRHAETLSSLWAELRKDSDMRFLDEHFFPGWQNVTPAGGVQGADAFDLPEDPVAFRKAFYFCTQLIQLMESVYLDFDLETNESSPDLRGWMNLFRHWTWSYMFRVAWALTSPTYGARFQVFCERVFRLHPTPAFGAAASRLPDAIALRLVEGKEAHDLLNPVEQEIEASVRANGAAGAKLYVLALEAAHPMNKAKTRGIPTGFALCENDDLLYLRTQDHLRQTGLGGAFLDALVKGAAASNVRPVGPKDPALIEWKAEEMELWVRRRCPGFVKGRPLTETK